jgi:hypothetical protein
MLVEFRIAQRYHSPCRCASRLYVDGLLHNMCRIVGVVVHVCLFGFSDEGFYVVGKHWFGSMSL